MALEFSMAGFNVFDVCVLRTIIDQKLSFLLCHVLF